MVAVQLSLDSASEAVLEDLAPTVAAVNVFVGRYSSAPDVQRAYGAMMLAARLFRRRNSPEGVATFTQDGPVYVQRNDPDVAMMLGFGAWATPVVG